MAPKEIVAKCSDALEIFDSIEGQPSDIDMKIIWEALPPLLLQIPYDEFNAKHNLVGIIKDATRYLARYGEAFAPPTKVGAYDPTITDKDKLVVRAYTEAKH